MSQIRMNISAKSPLTHLIVYTPTDSARFAFEPATHAIDSFNLSSQGIEKTGTQLLTPGESLEGEWSLALSEE
jgi:galactose mutarotase-like enzyme